MGIIITRTRVTLQSAAIIALAASDYRYTGTWALCYTITHEDYAVCRAIGRCCPRSNPSLIWDIHYRCSLRYACQLFWKFSLRVLNFCLYQRFFNPKLSRRSMIWKLKNWWPSLLPNVWIFVTYELVRMSESILNIPLKGGSRLNRQLIRLE